MPFYLIHRASLSQTVKLVKAVTNLDIPVPGICEIMEPDLIDAPHAWDFREGVDKGNLMEYMRSQYAVLKETIKKGLTEGYMQRPLIFLNHYISDGLSVGQTDARLWGIKDDLIDTRMEMVIKKTGLIPYKAYLDNPLYFQRTVRLSFPTEDSIFDLIYNHMKGNHDDYFNKLDSFTFWIKGIRNLAIDCVDLSAILTTYLFYHAIYTGGTNGENG